MTARLQRRTLLAGLGAFALSPSFARARPSAPAGPFTLERVLARSLVDEARLIVTRRWAIAFEATGAGTLTVTGHQSHAQADAPPALQALARIEAQRDESALFPLRLDRAGHILGEDDDSILPPLPDEVIDAALAYAEARTNASDAQGLSRQFLADLSQRGEQWLSRMPADLFFPTPRDRTATREIALPDGGTGTIAMRETATAEEVSGLLVSYRREAATTTRSTTRTGSETWTLVQAVS